MTGSTVNLESEGAQQIPQCWEVDTCFPAKKKSLTRRLRSRLFSSTQRQSSRVSLSGKTNLPASLSETKSSLRETADSETHSQVATPVAGRRRSFEFIECVEDMSPSRPAKEAKKVDKVKNKLLGFVKRAQEGVWCTYFEERTQERKEALYCIDDKMQNMIVLTGRQLEHQEVVCPVDSIVGAWRGINGDGAIDEIVPGSAFPPTDTSIPPSVLDMLELGELERMVVMSFACASTSSHLRFCILEDNVRSATDFVQSISVLSRYAQTMKDTNNANFLR